jgi:plastocyanin
MGAPTLKQRLATLAEAWAAYQAAANDLMNQLNKDAELNTRDTTTTEELLDALSDAFDDVKDAATDVTDNYPTFSHGGNDYKIKLPEMLIDGVLVTAEEAADDEDIAAGLAEGNSDMIVITKPAANFSGSPLTGEPGDTVEFTDSSTNSPTSWAWDFGDHETSDEQNPEHVYADAGTYTVVLTATNAGGSDTKTRVAYVVIAEEEGG